MADVNSIADLRDYVSDKLGAVLLGATVDRGELAIEVPRDNIVKVLTFLRDDPNCLFKQLMDVCGVDHPERERRFDVVYNLLSLTGNTRIRVLIQTDEERQTCEEAKARRAARLKAKLDNDQRRGERLRPERARRRE